MRGKRRAVIAAGFLAAAVLWILPGESRMTGIVTTAEAAQAEIRSGSAIPTVQDSLERPGNGSLRLDLTYSEGGAAKKLEGGSIAIYLAAGTTQQDGDRKYDVSSGKFASVLEGSGIARMDSETLGRRNAALSEALEKACGQVQPDAVSNVEDGNAMFAGLDPGLYFVRQKKESDGGRRIKSFLISVPDAEGRMEVTAAPKLGFIRETPDTAEPGTNRGSSSGGRLPQTGQLWWPVPVLSACGIALILTGEAFRKKAAVRRRKKEGDRNRSSAV